MFANIMGSDGLIVIVVAAIVLFGGSQLPKLAKNVGAAGHEFRRAQREAEAEHAVDATRAQAAPVVPVSTPAVQLPAAQDNLVVSRSELREELAKLMQERGQASV